jgi:hypothetical protein
MDCFGKCNSKKSCKERAWSKDRSKIIKEMDDIQHTISNMTLTANNPNNSFTQKVIYDKYREVQEKLKEYEATPVCPMHKLCLDWKYNFLNPRSTFFWSAVISVLVQIILFTNNFLTSTLDIYCIFGPLITFCIYFPFFVRDYKRRKKMLKEKEVLALEVL